MKMDILLGLQWGDEGKGKVVDVICPDYDIICRFQGGPNAGHTLDINGIKTILHTIPSGIFWPEVKNVIGNGVVIDPVVLKKEIERLNNLKINLKGRLYISKKAHLILPTHRILDAASEAAKGVAKIGSTLKGIGPTYMDKTGRNGLRVGDILLEDFKEKYEFLKQKHKNLLSIYNYEYNAEQYEQEWFEGIEILKSFDIINTEQYINESIDSDKRILAEGAQGTLLDIDFGSYPFVTSSNTICAGACTGLGVAPTKVGKVIGIAKAYCTRVGSGPFPTEDLNETGEKLRKIGNEYGSTTGRPRRCGWLDLVALRYSIMINGTSELILTKTDVLNDFDVIKICTAYKTKDGITNKYPFDLSEVIDTEYTELKGWKCDLSDISSIDKLPKELLNYIAFIEKETGVPVRMISTGPERKQILLR
jgi:adenylosuccinate synthase